MLIWYSAGAAAAIVIAWLASLIHASGHAPVGLISLAVGVALGVVLTKIATALRVAGTRRLVVGTVLLAILTVVAEHTWLYLDFRRQWRESREKPQVAVFRPETPWSLSEFFRNEATPERATVWCIDAALIVAAAVTTVAWLNRVPTSDPPAPSP
jgi:hypothetical protein